MIKQLDKERDSKSRMIEIPCGTGERHCLQACIIIKCN